MSDKGAEVVPIPGGMKLLENVEGTGQALVRSAEIVREFRDKIPREKLIEMVEKQGEIGEVMLDALTRVRRKMNTS